MQLELSILTFNIWGIPLISKDREIRIKAIGQELVKGHYDIVSLQEVWSENDFQYLKKFTENVLPFAHYFYSGVLGSGLCLLSKYPIITTFYHSWSVNGYFHRIQHGDWFGGKGVGLCKLLINEQIVNVYIAHLHAEYNRKNDDYVSHRVIQAYDTAQFIETTRGDSILQILAGDLNTEPDDLAYRILLSTSKLKETYHSNYGKIATNECSTNSYTTNNIGEFNGKRIDYILYRSGVNYKTKVLEYKLPFSHYVPGYQCSYSDHEAVYAKIIISKLNYPSNKLVEMPTTTSLLLMKNSNNICNNEDDGNDNDDDDDNVKIKQCLISECNEQINNCIENNNNHNDNSAEYIDSLEKCIEICDVHLRNLYFDKITYFILTFCFTLLSLYLIDYIPPYGFRSLYLIIKVFLAGITLYALFMATLWNSIERHGILSGKLSMEISLKQVNRENTNYKN